MAGTKISELPAATLPLTGAELVPVVQGGATKQTALATIPYVPSGTGAVTRTVQAKLSDTVSVKDFGAKGDGVTDDSAAINAAMTYAASIANVYKDYVTVLIPQGTYRIKSHLIARNYVRVTGYGANLQGPITGYDRITATTAIPAAFDVVGQTSGACWTDETPTTNPNDYNSSISGAMWEGLTLQGFRYGFASRLFAWVYPHIRNCTFISCDIACIAFNGAQMWTIENPSVQLCGTLFVGAATAYTSGNPLSSAVWTGSFCDGLIIRGHGQFALNCIKLSDVDSWFSAAILRPSSISTAANFSGTFKLAGLTPTALSTSAQNVTGRAFYIPQRNNRLTFDCGIYNLHVLTAPRGYGLIANPTNATISHLRGEYIATDPALTNECGILVGIGQNASTSIEITGVDTRYWTGTNYDSVVGFVRAVGTPAPRCALRSLTGKFNIDYLTNCSFVENLDDPAISVGYSFSQNRGNTSANYVTPIDGTYYVLNTDATPSDRSYDTSSALSLLKRTASNIIPQAGGTETKAYFIMPVAAYPRSRNEPVQGRAKVFVRRLDTGVQDYGDFLITWAGQNSSSTLSANASTGGTSVTVGTGLLFGPGTVVLVNGADKYVVKNYSGNTVNFCTPLRNNYISGNTIASVNQVDATIRALSGGIASLSFSGTSLVITNSLGSSVPIEFRVEFDYFGSPPQ